MAQVARRALKEGVGLGIIAGLIFAVAWQIVAATSGAIPFGPLRLFSSVVLGSAALTAVPLFSAMVVGIIVHLILSGAFGALYGLINSQLPHETQRRFGLQALIGVLFGVVIWLINFQVIARLFYPWFLATSQPVQILLHALFFGLPLGLMYAAAERRMQPVRGVPEAV